MAEKKTTSNDYTSMKKDELLAIAKEMGAKVNTKTRKADIIAAIEAIEKDAAGEEKPKEAMPEKDKAEEPKKKAKKKPAAKEEKKTEEVKPEEEAEKKTPKKDEEKSEEKADIPLTSTERKRKEKAERREAKAARKEANRVEEKKKRPSNIALAILIFGVLFAMFAFVGGYNYFSKPATIEKYLKDSGMADVYTDVQYDEHSTATVRADGNTVKVVIKVAEDTPADHLDEYKGEDGTKDLKLLGANLLTSWKPEAQGLGGTVKVGVKQGDKTINYVKLSYREAKKVLKDAQKEAEEEAEEAEDAAEAETEEAEETSEATEDAED